MANTLYDTLEVIPTASPETIHAAYRSLISRNHPDKMAALGPELQAIANARTKEINHAYDILRDAARRANYDEELRETYDPSPHWQDYAEDDAQDYAAAQGPSSAAPTDLHEPRGPRLRATFLAALAGAAALLTLLYGANVTFGVVDFFAAGQARYVQDFENSIDTNVRYSGHTYLLVLWGWLFVGYLFGLISYRLAVRVSHRNSSGFDGRLIETNGRLFLFLTFVCVVVGRELISSAHTLTGVLTDMFVLAGAYRAARVTALSPRARSGHMEAS